MPVTRVVDSDDDASDRNETGGGGVSDNNFVDDEDEVPQPTKRPRFTAQQKGKGQAGDDEHKFDEDVAIEDEEEYDEGPDVVKKGRSKGTGTGGGGGRAKLSWEEEYSRSWDIVTEDVHGSLEGAVAAFLTSNKRRRVLRDTAAIQRGIIRHLFLILDLSESMTDRDMRPSRLELSTKYAAEFVAEFFDQNPISQLAIVGTRDGMAERISNLGGNPVEHIKTLQHKKRLLASGEPSLQNALNMARSGLAWVKLSLSLSGSAE